MDCEMLCISWYASFFSFFVLFVVTRYSVHVWEFWVTKLLDGNDSKLMSVIVQLVCNVASLYCNNSLLLFDTILIYLVIYLIWFWHKMFLVIMPVTWLISRWKHSSHPLDPILLQYINSCSNGLHSVIHFSSLIWPNHWLSVRIVIFTLSERITST